MDENNCEHNFGDDCKSDCGSDCKNGCESDCGSDCKSACGNGTSKQITKSGGAGRLVRLRSVVAVCLVLCFVVGLAVFALTNCGCLKLREKRNAAAEINERFGEVDELLRRYYDGEPDSDRMLDFALGAYVAGVGDPYTEYMKKDVAAEFINGDFGSKKGIGVLVCETDEPEGIYVSRVFDNSPAEKAGILPGDVIVEVGGVAVTHEKYRDSIAAIAGKEGSAVVLTVLRGSEKTKISVVRGSFEISPVEYEMLDGTDGVAYIRIEGVATGSAEKLKEALEALKRQGAKACVFDLREDGGGYLDEVTDMLDMLLPEGPIVRYTHKGEDDKVTMSDADRIVELPMAVLINGNTASAAELFAAALRDYKLAVLVGETTFGKGVIQTMYTLKNGDSLKITTGKYSPPYGENFHGVGVKPDIEVSLPDGKAYFQLSRDGDTQLQAAVKALANQTE